MVSLDNENCSCDNYIISGSIDKESINASNVGAISTIFIDSSCRHSLTVGGWAERSKKNWLPPPSSANGSAELPSIGRQCSMAYHKLSGPLSSVVRWKKVLTANWPRAPPTESHSGCPPLAYCNSCLKPRGTSKPVLDWKVLNISSVGERRTTGLPPWLMFSSLKFLM